MNHRLGGNFVLLLLCAGLCLVTTACFRDTSEANYASESQPVAREAASATAVATDAPQATLAVETVEEVAEESVEALDELEEPNTGALSTGLSTDEPPDTFALTATALIARLTEAAGAGTPSSPVADAAAADTAADAASVPATSVPLLRVTARPGEDCVHEIRAGETMFMLSLAYGSTVDEIAAASEIDNPDRIAVGQRITIPGCGTTGFAPPPTSLPSPTPAITVLEPVADSADAGAVEISDAAEEAGFSALVQQAQSAILNNAQASADDGFGAQAVNATSRPNYTVQANDTLLGIALQFGTSIEALAALNNIADVNTVRVGDVLQIP